MLTMSKLPVKVTTDADTDPGVPQASGSSQGRQPSRRAPNTGEGVSGSPRTRPRRAVQDSKKKVPPDIRSVDSGYCETSYSPDMVSPDAVPSNPTSLSSVNLGESPHYSSPARGRSDSPLSSSVDTVSQIQEHLVHKIHRAVGEKEKEKEESSSMSMPPILSPSSSYSSSAPSSTSLPSELSEVTERDIKELLKEMPPDMRVDFQDAMVLYCEDDKDRVDVFMEHFSEIKLYERVSPKVVLYDDIAISIGSKFKALEFGIDRCTYVFLFITKVFCEDSWSEFSSETCLMEAIHNPDKKWCVVPVFTEPKRSASFRIPPSLNSLKGIQYWTNDKFFRDSMQKLLEEKLFIRKKKEKQLTKERKDWVTKYRIEKIHEEIREEKENLARQERELEAKRKKEHEMAELKRKQKEAELQHEQEIRQIKSDSDIGMQQMMQQFAKKFHLATSGSDCVSGQPPNMFPHSRSLDDMMQYLLQMSQQATHMPNNAEVPPYGGNPQQGFYLPSRQHSGPLQESSMPPPYTQFNLATRDPQGCGTAIQERQRLQQSHQESRGPFSCDQGSTGFTVPQQTRWNEGSGLTGSAQFFSLPNQPRETSDSSDFRSLPYDFSYPPGQRSHGDRDLEVDQPPGLESLQTVPPQVPRQMPQQGMSYPHAGIAPVHSAPAGPDVRAGLDPSAQHQGVGFGTSHNNRTIKKTAHTSANIAGQDAKEVHYHYHLYPKPQDKSDSKSKEEQAPINIVGAKVVQIGDNNLVKVLDKSEFMEGENADEEESSDDELTQLGSRIPGASTASEPPSTIYQDNNPSVAPGKVIPPLQGTPSTRPVQLPTRPKETLPSESVRQYQTPTAHPPVQGGSSVPASVNRPDVPYSTVPQHPSVGASFPIIQSSRTSEEPPSTLHGPISSGPMAGISQKDLSTVPKHSVPPLRHPVAMVRPMASPSLVETGSVDDTTVLKQLGRATGQSVVVAGDLRQGQGQEQRVEFEMAPQDESLKGREEEEPITEQTLLKQRALESEVD